MASEILSGGGGTSHSHRILVELFNIRKSLQRPSGFTFVTDHQIKAGIGKFKTEYISYDDFDSMVSAEYFLPIANIGRGDVHPCIFHAGVHSL